MKSASLFFGLVLLSLIASCKKEKNSAAFTERYTISSDLETTVSEGGKLVFESDNAQYSFGSGEFASTDFALSGKQSIKLNQDQIYGLNLVLNNVQEGQFIRASVWQKEGGKDGVLSASVKGEKYINKFRTYYNKKAKSEKGWVQHYLTFVVTKGAEEVNFFIFSGKQEAYFDDIKIEVLPTAPDNNLSKSLDLIIPAKGKRKLNKYINFALQSEIIEDKYKKYVKAHLNLNGDTAKVKMKLKGDWTDHLRSGKTSYRIKMSGNDGFYGLKSFSIQHPKTRNNVQEWVIHKIADGIDLLTTRYDFINVTINGFNFGVYALEEHFDKQLVESRNRREGPILKFDETGAWAFNQAKRLFQQKFAMLPYFQASTVSVFKEGRTLSNPRLKKNFEEGRSLLTRFKNGTVDVETAFDVDLMAKFYVMNELSSHNHALAWHNRRFYFNPITQKLEPILFDVIPHAKTNDFSNNLELRLTGKPSEIENIFDNQIFLNKKFTDRYLYHLKAMTTDQYLDSVFKVLEPELNVYVKAIAGEDESYVFDKDEYYRNAAYLRGRIDILDSIIQMAEIKPIENFDWEKSLVYKSALDTFFVKDVSINAFLNEIDSRNYEVEMLNYHVSPITVLGFELDKYDDSLFYFEQPIVLNGYVNQADSKVSRVVDKPKKLLLEVSNVPNKVFKKGLIEWPSKIEKTTREILEDGFKNSSAYYSVSGNKITLKGSAKISQMVYIPSKYTVEVLPGSTIEFKDGGGLIVNNDFTAMGTKDSPISFTCKDSSSHGVTILNADNGVKMAHVNFIGLSNLNYGKWELSGAVNIHESETEMSYVTVDGNTCEDALNIIRSNFTIDHLLIQNTTSDGFDADFCTGSITESKFVATGNDCIDFSGSVVEITNIEIVDSGDKGISGGEGSTLTIRNIDVNGAITGVASKDRSVITGSNVTVTKSEYGFGAFQKKGEYAPAKIILENSKWTEVQVETLIDKGSVISLNGKEEKGTVKIDVDKLYERFGPK
ncbi:MAG: CotH kinase family protein [Crocinitomicaceae bacterium]